MRGWLIDSNVIAELVSPRANPAVDRWAAAQDEESLFISVLTLAEYDKGIENLPDVDDRRAALAALRDGLADRFQDRLLGLSNAIVRRWGGISGRVRRTTGHPPPVVDTLLAATAQEFDLYLATRNVKDVKYSGAAVFNPWVDDPARFPLDRRGGGTQP